MTSPEVLAVERFLHRFTRRSLDPIPTDGLIAAKLRIDGVLDERGRQFSFFEAPYEPVRTAAPAPVALQAPPEPAPPVSQIADVLSPSQVRSYLDCSARWWYKYGLSLPDPKGSSLVRGIVVHRMVEIFLRAKASGAAPVADDLAGIFDDVWDETAEGARFQPDEEIAKIKSQAAQLTRMYLDEIAPEIEPAVIAGEPAIEMRVSGEIAGVKVRGIVDLLDTSGRICDLKTAARKPSGISSDYAFQIATYAEIAPQVTGEAQLVTLVATKTPQLITMPFHVSDADRQHVRTLYPRVQDAMRAGAVVPNRGSNLCSRKHCNFWEACEAEYGGRVGGGARDDLIIN
jgi:putative RecB family exonuclease